MNEALAAKAGMFCTSAPPELLDALARALEEGHENAASLQKKLGLNADVARRLAELLRDSSRAELAAALRMGACFCRREEARRSSFVWSGPSAALEARKTEQVILDLVQGAEEELLLVSFAAYKVPSLLCAVQKAVDRGVRTRFVLETEDDSEGRLNVDASEAFSSLTGALFYHWPKEKRESHAPGMHPVMHAKCVVTEKAFFISSANLTEHAVSCNMELGFLSFDREKAAVLLGQFTSLIAAGILKKMVKT